MVDIVVTGFTADEGWLFIVASAAEVFPGTIVTDGVVEIETGE
jgi:hypothetical protein